MRPRTVADCIRVKGRFARSVRLDAHGAHELEQLEGYLPTARSLEVVRRIVRRLDGGNGAGAFSITGPYGSGKSSLALFIRALLAPADSELHRTAIAILQEYDEDACSMLRHARASVDADIQGFVPAVVTAPQRESVTTTVLRALLGGALETDDPELVPDLEAALLRAESQRYATPSHLEVHDLLARLAQRSPVLLVLDEFGKNLESYAEHGRDGDLYLLQGLAEWAHSGLRVLLVTIQHLAFEAYAQEVTTAQRREWAKVQGRFEDIAYVDAPSAARRLVAAALEHSDDRSYRRLRAHAARVEVQRCEEHGQPAISDEALVEACYPLHPTTLLVLPELCARYGQNERTLFSYLASDGPRSMRSAVDQPIEAPLGWARLDHAYDYFVEAGSSFVGQARDATRWIEVETTIRDASGLTTPQARLLRAVGVLNLVATGGPLRASESMLVLAMSGAGSGLEDEDAVRSRLGELVELGVVTHRDFAKEYRLWEGSDFDLSAALLRARRQLAERSLATLLTDVHPMRPLVAARHSIQSGAIRAFAQAYAGGSTPLPEGPKARDPYDGILVHLVDDSITLEDLPVPESDLPVVVVVPEELDELRAAALEVAALQSVASDGALPEADRAARRELAERHAIARQALERVVSSCLCTGAAKRWWLNPPGRRDGSVRLPRRLIQCAGTAALSQVFDDVFEFAPRVAYEAVNRTELTSAGARARRDVLEAMVNRETARQPRLGLQGDGAEVATYRAVLEDSGIHAHDRSGPSPFARPDSRRKALRESGQAKQWKAVWDELVRQLKAATDAPVSGEHLLQALMTPPYGMRQGSASILVVAGLLAHAGEIAMYEHGNFRPYIDAAIAERLVRNPENFAVKHLATGADGPRRRFLHLLSTALDAGLESSTARRQEPTLLSVAARVLSCLRGRSGREEPSAYVLQSCLFHAAWDSSADVLAVQRASAVRDALTTAREPDTLLFVALPGAVGEEPVSAGERIDEDRLGRLAETVARACGLLVRALPVLHERVRDVALGATHTSSFAELAAQARALEDLDVLAPEVRALAERARIELDLADESAWAESIGAVPTGGYPPSRWADDARVRSALKGLAEIGTAFHRVSALARAAGEGDPSAAFAVSLTAPDGRINRDPVVQLTAGHRPTVERVVGAALDEVRRAEGIDVDEATRAVLARLAELLTAAPEVAADAVDHKASTRRKTAHG